MKRLLLFTLALLVVGVSGVQAKKPKMTDEEKALLAAKVEVRIKSRDYNALFQVVTVDSEVVNLQMPAYVYIYPSGQMKVYLPPQMGVITGDAGDYKVVKGKKGEHVVTFWGSYMSGTLHFKLTVYPNGVVTMRIEDNNKFSFARHVLQFDGDLTL